MTADLKKLRTILTPPERRKSLVMLVLVVLMALAETAGVLSIMPFLSVLARPDVVHENALMQAVYTRLDLADTRAFIIALGLASIVASWRPSNGDRFKPKLLTSCANEGL